LIRFEEKKTMAKRKKQTRRQLFLKQRQAIEALAEAAETALNAGDTEGFKRAYAAKQALLQVQSEG
jgi:hypothetical protein